MRLTLASTETYNEQQSRNLVAGLAPQPALKQRRFLFDWDYTISFDLTKSLQLNFNATNSYIYDTFNNDNDIQIFDDFFNTGRANHYHQKLNATYNLPINKIPFLEFIKADYGYTADFRLASSSTKHRKWYSICRTHRKCNSECKYPQPKYNI